LLDGVVFPPWFPGSLTDRFEPPSVRNVCV